MMPHKTCSHENTVTDNAAGVCICKVCYSCCPDESEQVKVSQKCALHAVLLEIAFQSSHEGCEAPESLGLVTHDVQDG